MSPDRYERARARLAQVLALLAEHPGDAALRAKVRALVAIVRGE